MPEFKKTLTPNNTEPVSANRLSVPQLMLFCGPSVPMAMLLAPLIIYLPTYYATEVGISLFWVGAAFMVARLWDGVTDPLIGILSDASHSRFGRRRIWIIAGLIPLMASAWFLCRPQGQVGPFYLFLWLIIFYISWTSVQVPYLSWSSELSTNYHDRSRIFAFRESGTILGIGVAYGVPILLLPADAPLNQILDIFIITLLIILPLTLLPAAFCTKEAPPKKIEKPDWGALYTAMLTNKPYRYFIVVVLIVFTAVNISDAVYILLVTQHLQLPGAFMSMVLIQYAAAIVFAPVTLKLSRRYGRHRVLLMGYLCFCLLYTSPSPRDQRGSRMPSSA